MKTYRLFKKTDCDWILIESARFPPIGFELAEIKPNLIDRISVGDDVDIRFTTFSLTPFLVVSGEIVTISSDILMTQKREPYYLARVKVTDAGFEKLGNRKLRPGMEVGVVIKTGSRTLLTYLLHPLTRRIAFSLKEE